MKRLLFFSIFLFSFFLTKNVFAATEFVSIIDPDNGSGTDYTSLSSWEAANQVDLTAATTLVIAGSLTRGTIADGTPITQTTSGATAVCVHHSATQMLISTLTGTPNATDTWFPTVDGSDATNAWTPTTAGDSAIAIAKCRSTAGTADTTAVIIDGWTTSATNYIKIWTDPSENYRHNGVWDEGKYRIQTSDALISVSEDNIKIDGLQLYTSNNSGYPYGVRANGATGVANVEVSNSIIKGYGVYSWINSGAGISLSSGVANSLLKAWNNVIYDFGGAGNGRGITITDADGTLYAYNNTIANCTSGLNQQAGVLTAKNNIVEGSGNTNAFVGTFTSSNYNATDGTDTGDGGANSRQNQNFIFADEVNDDFHLDSADTGARNQGAILYDSGDDANLNFTTDIDNNARLDSAGTWDIGADEAITKVYRSVGPSATTAIATGATYGNVEVKPAYVSGSTTNIADYVATFWSDLPTNVGVGDALQYDDDDDGDIDASDSIVFITKRIDAAHYSVRTVSGAAPASTLAPDSDWSIFRSYTSLFNAEAGTENTGIDADLVNFDTWSGGKNLQTGQEQWNIACYANGTTADTVATTINDWTTSADSFIKVYTPTRNDEVGVSQRHSGVWDDGKYKLIIDNSAAIIDLDDYVKIEGLQVRIVNTNVTTKEAIDVNFVTALINETKISDNIIDGQGSSYSIGIYSGDADTNIKIWNNFIYDCNADFFGAVRVSDSNTSYIYNNTIMNSSAGIIGDSDGNTVAKNNIVKGCGDSWSYYYDFATGTDYNATDGTDNIGIGSNNRISQTFSFADSANKDFHLAPGDTGARNFGTDLSNDPYIPSNTDIDSACLRKDNQSRVTNGGDDQCYTRPRGTSWDIGADEMITKIYRSVAPDADGNMPAIDDDNSQADTLSVATTGTATFEVAVTNIAGVGDALVYDSDGDNDLDASDTILFISGRTDSTHYTVRKDTGALPTASTTDNDKWALYRAYTSIYLAEAGTKNTAIPIAFTGGNRDIATNSEQWNIACYANGTTADETRTTVSGWTTAAQNYIKIYTPYLTSEVGTSQRHQGKWDTSKYYLAKELYSTAVSYVKIDGLQIFLTGDDEGYWVRGINSGPNAEISNNIVRANNLTGSQAHIGIINGSAGIIKIYNNIIYDFNGSDGNDYGIYVTAGTSYVYNNTVYNCQYGIIQAYASTVLIAKNNIVKGSGNTIAYYGTFTNSDYNATDGTDTTGQGAHSKISQTFSFVDETNDDFHLSPSDTAARNSGADLSQDYWLPITNDIDGNARTSNFQYPNSNYDIGADESATPIYRSIAPSMSTYLDRGVDESGTDLSISGTTLTLENAAPDNVGVGDAIQYDSDGNSSIDAIAFISARASSTSFTVQGRDGANPVAVTNDQDWQIFRAYTTLDNAEGGAENTANIDDDVDDFDISVSRNDGKDIYTSNEQWNIAAYANGVTADTVAVTVDGWTTYPTNYIKVYTPVSASEVGVSQRHSGMMTSNAYQLSNNIQDNINYIVIEGLQINYSGSSQAVYIANAYDGVNIKNNIIKGVSSSSLYGVRVDGNASVDNNIYIFNNIIYDFFSRGIFLQDADSNYYILNNTLYNTGSIGIRRDGGTAVIKNNLVQNNTNYCYYGTFNEYANNISSDATSPDGASYQNKTVSFADSANSDFHLSSSDTSARDAGVNLWSDANIAIKSDIDGDPRSESVENWDIGADEGIFYQSNVSGMGTATMQMSLTDKMTDGLVGMWSFDGPDIDWTTNTAYDRSPAGGNDGTITGATPAIGKKGQALNFSQAIGNKIDLGQPTFNLTNQISIFAWVKSVQDDYGTIISKHGNNPSYGWKLSRFADLDLFEWRISTNGTDWNGGFASNDSFPINTWINVVATYDNSFMRVYINGVENITGDFPYILNGNIYNSSATAQIGRNDYNGDSTIFNGQIDEVRIYNRALSSDEVLRLYNLGNVEYVR